MGAVISPQAAQGLLKAQAELIAMGAKPLVAMRLLEADSALLTPGLLDVSGVENIPDEEYFGPLLCVDRYTDMDDAIAKANNTRFGLSAGLLDDNRDTYEYFLPRVRAGTNTAKWGGTTSTGNLLVPIDDASTHTGQKVLVSISLVIE